MQTSHPICNLSSFARKLIFIKRILKDFILDPDDIISEFYRKYISYIFRIYSDFQINYISFHECLREPLNSRE